MASGLLNYTYFLKLLKISELPLHLVSFQSPSILLPLGASLSLLLPSFSILCFSLLCPLLVLVAATIMFWSSPLLWSLSFSHAHPPSPDFLNRIQTLNMVWWSSSIWCPQPSSSFLPLSGLTWLASSSSTLHWVLPALHICSCYRLCQFLLPFSPTPPVLSCNCAHSSRFCSTPPWSHLWSLQGEMSPPFSRCPLHTDYASLTEYNYKSPWLCLSYSHHICIYSPHHVYT